MTAARFLSAVLLSACTQQPPEPARHITCSDRFTGVPVFAFWEDTRRDGIWVLGGPSEATVTLDSGKSAKLTDDDLNVSYACKVDRTK